MKSSAPRRYLPCSGGQWCSRSLRALRSRANSNAKTLASADSLKMRELLVTAVYRLQIRIRTWLDATRYADGCRRSHTVVPRPEASLEPTHCGLNCSGMTFRYPIDPFSMIDQLMTDPRLTEEEATTMRAEIRRETGFSGPVKRSLLYAPPKEFVTRVRGLGIE
jgi:hypothetical protein